MEIKSNEEWTNCIEKAVAGDKEALERIVLNLQDMVFNLSLRMLGTFPDAEDAAQDILLKVITRLATFRGERVYHLGVPHRDQSPDSVQKAHVRPEAAEL